MKRESRTALSKLNVISSIAGRIIGMICTFAGRGIFVRTLRTEYLGLGGFFGNIFSVISLCELGVGAAIAQSLYKPLAENDENKVSGIVGYYQKVNNIIGCMTLVLSLCCTPILPKIAKTDIEMGEIYCCFVLFAVHTALSYVMSAKKSLVICDQRLYAVTAVNGVVSVVLLVLQYVVLTGLGSYVVYLGTRILILTVRDIVINAYADKKYPFLSKKIKLPKEYFLKLKESVKALMWHKIGGTLCRSTDSILLSVYVGLSGMGKYSNYALVIGTVGAFFDVAINAVSASVGNLGAEDRGDRSENIMRKMYFLNFFLLTVGLSVLVCTVTPFIKLWLGEEMVFSAGETWIIAGCFYFSCIRDPVQIFLHNYGIFRQTELIPIVRATVNFVLSVIFVKSMGLAGVFLGTVISTVTVPLYAEVKMLYKYGFGKEKWGEFAREMTGYIVLSGFLAVLCYKVTAGFPETACGVAVKAVVSTVLSVTILCVIYWNNRYFVYYRNMLLDRSGRAGKKARSNS